MVEPARWGRRHMGSTPSHQGVCGRHGGEETSRTKLPTRRPARPAPWPMKLAEWASKPLVSEPTCSAAAPKPPATTCSRSAEPSRLLGITFAVHRLGRYLTERSAH